MKIEIKVKYENIMNHDVVNFLISNFRFVSVSNTTSIHKVIRLSPSENIKRNCLTRFLSSDLLKDWKVGWGIIKIMPNLKDLFNLYLENELKLIDKLDRIDRMRM